MTSPTCPVVQRLQSRSPSMHLQAPEGLRRMDTSVRSPPSHASCETTTGVGKSPGCCIRRAMDRLTPTTTRTHLQGKNRSSVPRSATAPSQAKLRAGRRAWTGYVGKAGPSAAVDQIRPRVAALRCMPIRPHKGRGFSPRQQVSVVGRHLGTSGPRRRKPRASSPRPFRPTMPRPAQP